MPLYDTTERFQKDFKNLSPEEKARFQDAIPKFVDDLVAGKFRKGLRVKGVQGAPGIFEMTWAPDGRATFQFGEPTESGDVKVIWRRIGGHDIFSSP